MPVLMIGPFPPPTHGMSAINEQMSRVLLESGAAVERLDTSAMSLGRGILQRLKRVARVKRAVVCLALSVTPTLYLSVSGGLGQVYEIIYVLIARMRGMKLFLHHHCYSYLDRPTVLSWALIRWSGPQALHIGLSPGMAQALRRNGAKKVMAISNSAFYPEATAPVVSRAMETIGFLGNIADEKGIFEFLDLADTFARRSGASKFVLAGPFQDSRVEASVIRRIALMANVEYLGPVYGEDKSRFFERIDVLIFPTKYSNEADPLTIHEAMMSARPVIAWERGAIAEVLEGSGGLGIPKSKPFVPYAAEKLSEWIESTESYREAAKRSLASFELRRAVAIGQLDDLVAMISADDGLPEE